MTATHHRSPIFFHERPELFPINSKLQQELNRVKTLNSRLELREQELYNDRQRYKTPGYRRQQRSVVSLRDIEQS